MPDKITALIPALVVVYNIKTGQYIFVNDAVEKLLGYKKTAFLTQGLPFASSLIHPDDLPIINQQNQTALQKANSDPQLYIRETFEYRMQHQQGHWVWLHSDGVIFSRDSKNQVELVMNVSVDITKRKEREEIETKNRNQAETEKNNYYQDHLKLMQLRTEIADVLRKEQPLISTLENCLNIIVENIPAVFSRIWLIDHDKQLLNLTASAGDYPPIQSIRPQLKIGEFAVGQVAKSQKAYITKDIFNDKKISIQNTNWSKQRDIKSFAGYPLFFKNKTVGVITVFATHTLSENTLISLANTADILAQEIERKKIETQLISLSSQKDEFIAIASHELKTPVTSLKAYTQVLENRFKKHNDQDSAALLNRMNSQIDRLTLLISDLLDVSKIEAGKLQFHITNFKLNELITEIVDEMQRTTLNHTIIERLDSDIEITGDRDRISQVLINFLSNAIKYSPQNQKIIVKTNKQKNNIKISVQDFGIGILQKEHKKIFERFFRSESTDKSSYPGLGLGLYICSEIIQRHHGSIGVTSRKNHGSTFFFSLPIR